MVSCASCGFFIPASVCRDDIKEELLKARLKGCCGEITNNIIFIPYIAWPDSSQCGKWMEPVG